MDGWQNKGIELVSLASKPGEYAFFRHQNAAINVWLSTPTRSGVSVLHELTQASRRACPEGISSIHWLERGSGVPTAGARAALAELSTQFAQHIAGVGVLLLSGDGFWASALRSALSGILQNLPNARFPLRFFGAPEELAEWLVPIHEHKTHTRLDPALLVQRVGEARSRAGAGTPAWDVHK
jgi:hypothetical protein